MQIADHDAGHISLTEKDDCVHARPADHDAGRTKKDEQDDFVHAWPSDNETGFIT